MATVSSHRPPAGQAARRRARRPTAATAALFKRYGTTPDWVQGVDDLRGDSPYSGRIKESVEAWMKQVCPDGKLTPEYLALVTE